MSATQQLAEIAKMFADAPKQVRLQALLDYSRRLPDLPPRLADDPELLIDVPECQTPFAMRVEPENGAVRIYFRVPAEAPTVRGYAGILHDALDGAPREEILKVPNDFYQYMGLQEAVSGQRLRGMGAILARLKAEVEALD
ncbi:MAG: SufE family protein [Acidimicrobiia bacterium]|jgi:cysteine desulfuration protein SufE